MHGHTCCRHGRLDGRLDFLLRDRPTAVLSDSHSLRECNLSDDQLIQSYNDFRYHYPVHYITVYNSLWYFIKHHYNILQFTTVSLFNSDTEFYPHAIPFIPFVDLVRTTVLTTVLAARIIHSRMDTATRSAVLKSCPVPLPQTPHVHPRKNCSQRASQRLKPRSCSPCLLPSILFCLVKSHCILLLSLTLSLWRVGGLFQSIQSYSAKISTPQIIIPYIYTYIYISLYVYSFIPFIPLNHINSFFKFK